MYIRFHIAIGAALVAMGLLRAGRLSEAAPPKAEKKAELKPGVAALLKQSTAAYQKMKSYQHTAVYQVKAKGDMGEATQEATYVLALDRPNR